ncbi:terminase small subunit [Gordonia phage Tardus]|uniref:Terminase small subunit n=1 Tax=Gordonia phage Tardus TaxID=2939734 RepID=A0A9E7J7D1_9CAUD|nr:terminase small subunit [Gordonia phage Tardus]
MARSKQQTAALNEKQTKLLELYIQGHKFADIAKEVGYANRSNAYIALQTVLKQRAQERAQLADHVLEIQLERFDLLIATHMQIATDKSNPLDAARSATVVLQISDRITRLLGLDQPQRHEVTVAVDDVDREIAALADAIMVKARADGVDVTAPILESLIEHGAGD